ncbi:MAG: TolC family protein [Gemmatimonadales bacterium]|nr:TolC family protein [Gemmatimonadales bacterium]
MIIPAAERLVRPGAALLLFMAPGSLMAQAPSQNDSVLARLTAEALAANPSLAATRATARAAVSRVRPAGALPDPMLSAGVMNLALPRFAFRETDFTEVDVELTQEFPWPGTLGAKTQAARAEAQGRGADVAARRREVVVRTAELYYRLRYVATARATLARQRRLLATAVEIATTRYATASAPQSDPLQARVALARLDAEETDLAEQQAMVGAELKALRNVRRSESLTIELIRPETVPLIVPEGRPDVVLAPESLSAHPRLAARRAAVEAAERAVRVEQLGGRPDFNITARYGARPLGADFFSAFVGIRVPLWAGRKQSRLADAARADADAARAALAEETAQLDAELQTVLAGVLSRETRLRLLTSQVVPSARATVEAVLRSYRVGQAPFLNVLAAEDSLYRAELEAAMVAAEHLTHLVMLEQLVLREEAQ